MKNLLLPFLCVTLVACTEPAEETKEATSNTQAEEQNVTNEAVSDKTVSESDEAALTDSTEIDSQLTPNDKMTNEPNPKVLFKTTEGDIILEIYENEVPTMAENFLTLVEEGKYDGTIFHRVIPGFMIQGGDFENFNGTGGHAAKGGMIADEFNDKFNHKRGILSMANRGPNTNGSQFFIMDGDAPWLDGKHSIFGNVVEGLDTVSSIIEAPRDAMDRPAEEIKITSSEIIRG